MPHEALLPLTMNLSEKIANFVQAQSKDLNNWPAAIGFFHMVDPAAPAVFTLNVEPSGRMVLSIVAEGLSPD